MDDKQPRDPQLEHGEPSEEEVEALAGLLRETREMPDDASFRRQADGIMASLRPRKDEAVVEDAPESWFDAWLRRIREAWNDMTRVEVAGWAVAATVLLLGVGFAATQLGETSTSPGTDSPRAGGVEVAGDDVETPGLAAAPEDDFDPSSHDESDTALAAAFDEDVESIDGLDAASLEALDAYSSDQFEPRAADPVVDVAAVDEDDAASLEELDDEELAVLVAALDDDPFFDTEYER